MDKTDIALLKHSRIEQKAFKENPNFVADAEDAIDKALERLELVNLDSLPFLVENPSITRLFEYPTSAGYRLITSKGMGIAQKPNSITVLSSVRVQDDDCLWLHVSASRGGKVPSYKDLCLIKEIFVGDERSAIQVFPKRSQHVSDYETLHLWSNLEKDDLLPDFRFSGTI